MNIAIITFYDADNMGAMLQALALKRYIEKKGHHVEHIRIRSDKEIMNSFYANCPSLDIKIYRYFLRFIKHPVNNIKLYPLFVASCKKQKWIIKRKKVFRNYLKQMKAINIGDRPFDLYVLGSDEIWNISSSLCREPVFWGNGYGPSIVYAACTSGADESTFRLYPEIINSFKNFKQITARDDNTINVIKSFVSDEVNKVVDPTILVEQDNIIQNYNKSFKGKYLLVYGYPYQWKKSVQFIKRFAQEKNLKIVSLWFYLEFADINVVNKPEEFIMYFMNAEFVVTTTFHGSIFSLLSKAHFVTYNPRDKARQLLDEFKLSDRIIEANDSYEVFSNTIQNNCNYDIVFDLIERKRTKSAKVLDGMILQYGKNN